MEIKLRNFESNIDPEEKVQDVKYYYSIKDSIGMLEINLTLPEESDPVEWFVYHLKDLYKGFKEYIVYHNKWKYSLEYDKGNKFIEEWYFSKNKMY